MAISKLQILMVGTDKASGPISAVGESLDKSFGGKVLKGAAVGLGAAAAATGALGVAAVKLAADAAPLKGVQDAFTGVAEAAGQGADEMLAALRDSSAGMVTNRDLMMSFNKASQLVSQDFAVKLPDAMGMLGKVAAATGEDMGFMMDSLVTGIGRLSAPILDNLGVQVSLSEASAAYAEELGKQASELTKAEQQTALYNQVLEKLAVNTAAMPDVAGSAQAQFASFGVTMKNLKDDVGLALLPVMENLMAVLGPVLTRAIETVMPYIQQFGEFLGNLTAAIFDAGIASGEVREVFASMFGEEVAGTIMGVIDSFILIKDTITEFVTGTLIPFVQEHWEALKTGLMIVGAVLAGAAIVSGIMAVVAAIAALFNPITLIIGVIALLAVAWTQNWGGIQEKTQAALEFIRNIINTVVTWIQNFWAQHGEQIMETAQAMWDGVVAIFEWFRNLFQTIFEAFQAAFSGDWELFGSKLREAWDQVWQAIKDAVSAAWTFISEAVEKGIDAIIKWFNETDWLQVGKDIISGIASGITSATQWVIDAVIAVAKAIWGALTGFFGSDSPSTLMIAEGANLMRSLGMGIQQTADVPSYAMAQASNSIANTTANSITVLGGINLPPETSRDEFLDTLAEFLL
jgi:phage-related protein